VLSEWGVFRNAAGPSCAAGSVCTLTLDGELGPAQVSAELRPEGQLLAFPEGAGTLRISPAETGRPADTCRIDPPLFGDHRSPVRRDRRRESERNHAEWRLNPKQSDRARVLVERILHIALACGG
jgi:hypothetical protein